MTNCGSIEIFKELAAEPSIPFKEWRVREKIWQIGTKFNLTPRSDQFGNLIFHISKGKNDISIALVAHMDHPGFEITKVENKGWVEGKILGGIEDNYLKDAELIIFSDKRRVNGKVVDRLDDDRWKIKFIGKASPKIGDIAIFNLKDYVIDGRYIYGRQVDDLIGCALGLEVFRRIYEYQSELTAFDLYLILTRAEEEGFIGTSGIISSKLLPKETFIINLEASKAINGIVPGNGPIIRVGDAQRTFNVEVENILNSAYKELSNQRKDIKVQRALMTGGMCEASAYQMLGNYKVTGLVIPLENYHNQGESGLLIEEKASIEDIKTAEELLFLAIKGVKNLSKFEHKMVERLNAVFNEYKHKLIME